MKHSELEDRCEYTFNKLHETLILPCVHERRMVINLIVTFGFSVILIWFVPKCQNSGKFYQITNQTRHANPTLDILYERTHQTFWENITLRKSHFITIGLRSGPDRRF